MDHSLVVQVRQAIRCIQQPRQQPGLRTRACTHQAWPSALQSPKPPGCQLADNQSVQHRLLRRTAQYMDPAPLRLLTKSWQLLVLMRPHVTASFREPPLHSSSTSQTFEGSVHSTHSEAPHDTQARGVASPSFLMPTEIFLYCNQREASCTSCTPCVDTPTHPQTAPNSLAVLLVQGLPGCTCMASQLACSLCPAMQASSQSHTGTPCASRHTCSSSGSV